jgi:hypothetical protein
LRLVNAARLAPLEELLAELGGNSARRPSGGSAPKTASASSAPAQFPSRSASTTAGASAPENFQRAQIPEPPSKAHLAENDNPRSATVAAASYASGSGAAAAVAPAKIETAEPAAEVAKPDVVATGLNVEQVVAIKLAIQAQQKFIGELLEHASRWELDGSELRIYFPAEESAFAGLIEGRETLEKLRISSSKVLGRSVRVCAKLETGAADDANSSRTVSTQEMRAQFENDPMVKSMLQRFGGRISEVRRRNGE